jgi:hypothetical protein
MFIFVALELVARSTLYHIQMADVCSEIDSVTSQHSFIHIKRNINFCKLFWGRVHKAEGFPRMPNILAVAQSPPVALG